MGFLYPSLLHYSSFLCMLFNNLLGIFYSEIGLTVIHFALLFTLLCSHCCFAFIEHAVPVLLRYFDLGF